MKKLSILILNMILLAPGVLAEEVKAVNSCQAYYDGLGVSFLDVGQGDAVLIRCPDGQTQIVIDAGESDEYYPQAELLFRKSLKSRMADDRILETAINTHPHRDHLYGFWSLLKTQSLVIRTYLDNGADNPVSELEEQIREAIVSSKQRYINVLSAELTDFTICPASSDHPEVRVQFLYPAREKADLLHCEHNLNDCSLVTKVDFQGVSFLFLADTTKNWEKVMLADQAARLFMKSDVVKIGHHGSGSTSSQFLASMEASLAILSTGKPGLGYTEKYAFPEISVVDRLRTYFAPRGIDFAEMKIRACQRIGSSCTWKERSLPSGVWSTAAAGTIDVYAKDNSFCVQSDRLKAIEFSR